MLNCVSSLVVVFLLFFIEIANEKDVIHIIYSTF
jgi:hypothetical protein